MVVFIKPLSDPKVTMSDPAASNRHKQQQIQAREQSHHRNQFVQSTQRMLLFVTLHIAYLLPIDVKRALLSET